MRLVLVICFLSSCYAPVFAQSENNEVFKIVNDLIDKEEYVLARTEIYSIIEEYTDPVIVSKGYEIIGDMYFESFELCKKGESMVEDKAVFIAAAEMYELAGSVAKLKMAIHNWPSIEMMFTEGHRSGDAYFIGCWINKEVILKTRP